MQARVTVRLQPDPIEITTAADDDEEGTEGLAPCQRCGDMTRQYVCRISLDGDDRPVISWRCMECEALYDRNGQETLVIILRELIEDCEDL